MGNLIWEWEVKIYPCLGLHTLAHLCSNLKGGWASFGLVISQYNLSKDFS